MFRLLLKLIGEFFTRDELEKKILHSPCRVRIENNNKNVKKIKKYDT